MMLTGILVRVLTIVLHCNEETVELSKLFVEFQTISNWQAAAWQQ